MITDGEIARWRLHSQHLAGPGLDTAADVVSGLLGVQAENHSQASWAAGHVVDALSHGDHLTRAALGERLAEEGLPSEGRGLMLVAAHAELAGLICSGAVQHGHHSYALLDERAPAARRLDREEALTELALRYVIGHGPATERDLAYWATLTLTDARAGLAAVAERLGSFDHDGRTFWFGSPAPTGPVEPRAHLLQIFDETHRGYQD